MKKKIIPPVLLTVVFISILLLQREGKGIDISVQDAYTMIQKDTTIVILDVRTVEEFTGESGHLKNALLIPVQELENRWTELEKSKDRTIIVYCRSGHRSAQATEILCVHGFSVLNLEGGIKKWNIEKLPVVIERH